MNNDVNFNLGVVTTVSGRWPRELPKERHVKYTKWLQNQYDFVDLVAPDGITVNNEEIEEVCHLFRQKEVDAAVIVIGAFTGDSAATRIAEKLPVPIFVWALPEPPFNGERLMSNALVAATMNCAALKRMGFRYHFLYGDENEPTVTSTLNTYMKAYHTAKRLRHTFMGLIGYRPTAFYSSTFDETLIRKVFGITMEEQDLAAVSTIAETIDKGVIKKDVEELAASIPQKNLPDGYLEGHSRAYHAIKQIVDQFGFNALVLKCWPEMGNMRITPCAILSRFADDNFVIGCEGDVNATISMLVLQYLSGEAVFMGDLININREKNSVLFWHCGQAARKLHGSVCKPELHNHSLAGEGVVVEGTLKTGDVTVCLFTNVGGKYRMLVTKGKALPTEKVVRGVMSEVQLETDVYEAVTKIGEEGIPHHYAVVWHNVYDTLTALAEYLGIEIVEV
jgi:L-fucose isomerase-like protein